MRRVVLGLAVTAFAVLPATSAPATQEIPPINCGIVSCTYPIDRKIEEINDATAGVRECIDNGIGAIQNWLQGTPQPGVCNP